MELLKKYLQVISYTFTKYKTLLLDSHQNESVTCVGVTFNVLSTLCHISAL